jgi:hypothetical protein
LGACHGSEIQIRTPIGFALFSRRITTGGCFAFCSGRAAEGAGFRLADYKEPHATYKAENKTWFVFYDVTRLGKSFGLFVNDETGAIQIVP